VRNAIEVAIIQRIHEIRGVRVMLDFDLAELYEVETKRLTEQVRRNIDRFPEDFMFQLSNEEWSELVAICDQLPNNIKHSYVAPFAFTEQGVAMLSGVLRSQKAIQENIKIMRAFVAIRQYVLNYAELKHELYDFMREANIRFDKNDARLDNNDIRANEIFKMLAELLENKKALENRPRIGFNAHRE